MMQLPLVPQTRRWYKLEDNVAGAWHLVIKAFFLAPVVWFLRVYDDHWAAKFRRKPDLHELARRARGESPQDAPIPLPKTRKRALSNPLPEPETIHNVFYGIRRARQRTDAQEESLLLTRLPPEVRQIIYEEVLTCGGQRLVHILRKQGRLGHWRCRLQDGSEVCDAQTRRCVEGWLAYRARFLFWNKVRRLDIRTDGELLALLLTCRAIYTEAIPILYSKNTFHFYDPGDLRYFARGILPHRLNTISTVMVDWERPFSIFNMDNTIPRLDDNELRAWRQCWGVIASMQNLTVLKVVLKPHKFIVPKARRMRMLQYMMDIHGLRTFELVIPWNDEADWEFAARAPFRVVRGPIRLGIPD